MKKFKKVALSTLAVIALGGAGTVLAGHYYAQPAPSPIIDHWYYGDYQASSNSRDWHTYSKYFVENAGYGSYAGVQSRRYPYNMVGQSWSNYGWAAVEVQQSSADLGIGMDALYGYYRY